MAGARAALVSIVLGLAAEAALAAAPPAPVIRSPADGAVVDGAALPLVFENLAGIGVYDWDFSQGLQFGQIIASGTNEPPSPGPTTTVTIEHWLGDLLRDGEHYCWRVRAEARPDQGPYGQTCFRFRANEPPTVPEVGGPWDPSGANPAGPTAFADEPGKPDDSELVVVGCCQTGGHAPRGPLLLAAAVLAVLFRRRVRAGRRPCPSCRRGR